MEEVVRIKHIVTTGTLIIALLSWLFVAHGEQIDLNRVEIEDIKIQNATNQTTFEYIKRDLNEIKEMIKTQNNSNNSDDNY